MSPEIIVDPSYRGKQVKNPNGSFSSERTITITPKDHGLDNKFYNIPSLVEGIQLSQEEAIKRFKKRELKAVGVANTLEEAIKMAGERSQILGLEMPKEESFDDSYFLRRQKTKKQRLDEFMESGIKEKETKTVPVDVLSELRSLPDVEYRKRLKEMGIQEEPGLIQPGKDPEKSFIENTLLSLTDPVEWASLAGGGAWQAARMGKSMVGGAIDWATMGIPSLAKGIKGFGKGIIEGLGAKSKEALIPIEKAMPGLKVGTEAIKEATQPTVAKLGEQIINKETQPTIEKLGVKVSKPEAKVEIPNEVSTVAEKMGSELNIKIEETSGQINRLANKWDSIKETATRGHITREESIAKGKELGMTIDTVKAIYPGTAMNAEQASALIDTVKPIADESVGAAQKYLQTRKPEDLHEALYKFYALMEVDPKRFGVIAEAGRTLSQLNEPISGINQYLNQFSKAMVELVPEGLTPEYLVHLIAQFETPEQLAIMARHVAKPGSIKAWSQALMEGWTMGLLSAPKTHAVNFMSNVLTAMMGPTERALAARLAFGNGSEHIIKGEALEMVYGMTHSFMDALTLATKSFKTGISQFGTEKAEYMGRKAISAEALNLSGTIGRAVDFLGEATRIPGRALVAADDLFKVINYNGNIRAMALRAGKGGNFEGEPLANFIEDFVKSPPSKAIELSREYANYMTFTKELDGVALSVQKGLENHPFLRVVVPFWRTPVDIFKFSLERTPFINALSGQLRNDIMAGGSRRDLAMGKIALGGMISSTAFVLAKAGYITGSGPTDKNLRKTMMDAGWKPDSIKIGDKFYGYGRLDPMSQFIGTIADFASVSDQLDQPRVDQYAMGLVLGYMNHMNTKSYLQGISNVLDAIKQPDQRGIDYVKRWTGSLVPTIGRHIEQQIDPTIREVNGFFDQIISEVPGWSSTLLPERNLKGDIKVSEGSLGPDMLSFINQSTESKDPVWKEIIDNKISISPVSKYIGGIRPPRGTMTQETEIHGIELTPKEHDWLVRMSGNEMKVDGKGMWDSLTELIKTPEYKNASPGPEGMKSLLVKSIINNYRELAKNKLMELDPKLNNLIIEKEKARIKTKMPQGAKP